MSTSVGVGGSQKSTSREAGIEAAEKALQSGKLTKADFALLFASAKHQPDQLLEGAKSVLGPNTRIFGGATPGVIANEISGYDGFEVGLLAFSSDSVKMDAFVEKEIRDREKEAGKALGAKIANAKLIDPQLLFFYDAVRNKEGRPTNLGGYILDGMTEAMPKWPKTIGAALAGEVNMQTSYAFVDGKVERQVAYVLALSGKLTSSGLNIHGTKPMSPYFKITKSHENVILEIDGKPAIQRIMEILGPNSPITPDQFPFMLVLGKNQGEKFGAFKPENYVLNVCFAVDPTSNALIMAETTTAQGEEVQIMNRSKDMSYMEAPLDSFVEKTKSQPPILNFYVNCIGRCRQITASEREDVEIVREKLAQLKAPLFGVYGAGEIGNIEKNRAEARVFTGVLSSFFEQK